MANKKENEKTNVMRLLEQNGIEYTGYTYGDGTAMSGTEVADLLGKDPFTVFKTMVTVGKSGQNYVFVIPCCNELDLKKAAAAVGEKSIEMIKSKELLPLTGYIHGGCSPIGMKKLLVTTVDETATILDTIIFSAGRIGYQVEVAPDGLAAMIPISFADLC